MLDHYKILKEYFDNAAYGMLSRIDKDPKSPSYGYVKNNWSDYYEGDWFFGIALACVEAYYLKGIKSYHDAAFLDAAENVLSGAERFIHDDGTIDLRITNFHDPSLCAFVIRDTLGPMIEIISKNTEHTPKEDALSSHMISILERMAPAVKHLGFHTPNHRWIFCAALSFIKKYLGDDEAEEVMNKFFWEGVDCDEYGEYTERSTGIYNRICNHSFLSLTHTYDKKYLEYPTRNMRLMRSFYEPDNTICTLNSIRQDRGNTPDMNIYYFIYLPLALFTHDPEFAYFADRGLRYLMSDAEKSEKPFEYIDCMLMYWFFAEEEWQKPETFDGIPSYLPKRNLDIYLPDSGTGRVYLNGATATVLRTNHPDFFKLQIGRYSVFARFGGSFFGLPHSQFRPGKMEKTERGFRLISNEEAGYRSLLDEPPETSNWYRMDHSKRKMINVRHFDTVADISFEGRKVIFDISHSGDDLILTKLELVMTPNGKVETTDLNFIAKPNDYVYLKSGEMTVRFDGGTALKLVGGSYAHFSAENMRGTEQVPPGFFTVCLSGSTPGKIHLEMEY